MPMSEVHFTLINAGGEKGVVPLIRTSDSGSRILQTVREHFNTGSPDSLEVNHSDGRITLIRLDSVAAVQVQPIGQAVSTTGATSARKATARKAATKKKAAVKKIATRKVALKKKTSSRKKTAKKVALKNLVA